MKQTQWHQTTSTSTWERIHLRSLFCVSIGLSFQWKCLLDHKKIWTTHVISSLIFNIHVHLTSLPYCKSYINFISQSIHQAIHWENIFLHVVHKQWRLNLKICIQMILWNFDFDITMDHFRKWTVYNIIRSHNIQKVQVGRTDSGMACTVLLTWRFVNARAGLSIPESVPYGHYGTSAEIYPWVQWEW